MSLCLCGCGKETNIYRGKPRKYICGHHNRNKQFLQETIQKMSKSHINKHHSEETKLKIGKANIGNTAWLGKKHTELTKDKIRKSRDPAKQRSEECRKKMSKSHMGMEPWNKGLTNKDDNRILNGKNNPSYGKPRYHSKKYYYDSPLQGKIYLRSSYELAYAKYLDSIKELWYYEIETFELSNEMTYTPDFFLPRIDKFIEIKGFMRYKDKEKIDRFLDEYPWNLEILKKEDLIKLGIEL